MKKTVPLWGLAAAPALLLILVPLAALIFRAGTAKIWHTFLQPDTQTAIFLSLRTSLLAVFIVALIGFPLAFFIANSNSLAARASDMVTDLPIVLPPAAAGIALLATFGRQGWLGQPLFEAGIQLTFTTWAVVIAQCFVGIPFFVRSVAEGLRTVDTDTIAAAAVDGAGSLENLVRVILPQCGSAIVAGLLLAWARALGEFGATLMFAGNFVGRTQTMPLAIYAGFESDLDVAIALSATLLIVAFVILCVAKPLVTRRN